jgi:hypothetical protein
MFVKTLYIFLYKSKSLTKIIIENDLIFCFNWKIEIFAIENLQFQLRSNKKQQINKFKILSRNIVHLIDEFNFWKYRDIIFTYLNVYTFFKFLIKKNMFINVFNEKKLVFTSIIWAQTFVINEIDFTYNSLNLQKNHVESLKLFFFQLKNVTYS